MDSYNKSVMKFHCIVLFSVKFYNQPNNEENLCVCEQTNNLKPFS